MPPKKEPAKPASRKQLIVWLANAIRWLPPNLISADGQMPPPWVKKAKAELKRYGITFVAPAKPSRKKRGRP